MKKIPLASRIIVPFSIILIGFFFCIMFFIGFCCLAVDYAMGYEGRIPILKLKLKRILYYLQEDKAEIFCIKTD